MVRSQPMHRQLDLVFCSYQVIHRKRIDGYRDVLPGGWYIAIQRHPLRRDALYGKLVRRQPVVVRCLVLSLISVPILLGEGGGSKVRRSFISPPSVSVRL